MALYCFSDLHGHHQLYEAINKFLGPYDRAICLGDCADRGPQGWKTLRAIYENPKITLLMGNHEFMLVDAMKEYLCSGKCRRGEYIELLFRNGGKETFNGWVLEGANPFWVIALESLPTVYKYNTDDFTFYLSHAGTAPCDYPPESWREIYDFVWNRDYIPFDFWSEKYKDSIVVHGHTPCQILNKEYPWDDLTKDSGNGLISYNSNHCLDIDNGTIVSNSVILFNLNTLEQQILKIN